MEITQEEFEAYVACQKSGQTNMFQTDTVQQITGLDRHTIKYIMLHYPELKKKYGDADTRTLAPEA